MNKREFNENESRIDVQNTDEQLKEVPKGNKRKRALLLLYRILVLLGIIIIILLLLFKPCNCNCQGADNSNKNTYFDTSVDDSATGSVTESAVNDLNAQVEDGMITMSMNANPVFDNGTAKGNLLIENDKSNKNPQVIQIYRNDTDELIYTSGKLPVGSCINEDTLDVVLPSGEYECTAYFNAIDDISGEKLGTSGANIVIHILN